MQRPNVLQPTVVKMKVSGRTAGGGGYLTRILKLANKGATEIQVTVTLGMAQDLVAAQIFSEFCLLLDLFEVDFTVRIMKEKRIQLSTIQ